MEERIMRLEQAISENSNRLSILETELPHIHKKLNETAANTKATEKKISELNDSAQKILNQMSGGKKTFLFGIGAISVIYAFGKYVGQNIDNIVTAFKAL